MKTILFSLIFLSAVTVKAQDADVETKVLAALFKQASTITVTNEDGSLAPAEKQLPNLFAKAIMQNVDRLTAAGGTLSGFSITCDGDGLDFQVNGGKVYMCVAFLTQNTVFKKDNVLINQSSEDIGEFTFEAIVPDNANFDVKIMNKSVQLTGRPPATSLPH